MNGERRDLTEAQRYGIWKRCHEKSEAWQAEQRRLQEEANQKRSEATKKRERTKSGTLVKGTSPATSSGDTGRDHQAEQEAKTSTAKAAAAGTNRGTVER